MERIAKKTYVDIVFMIFFIIKQRAGNICSMIRTFASKWIVT